MKYTKYILIDTKPPIIKYGYKWYRYKSAARITKFESAGEFLGTMMQCVKCGLKRVVQLATYERQMKNNNWTGLCKICANKANPEKYRGINKSSKNASLNPFELIDDVKFGKNNNELSALYHQLKERKHPKITDREQYNEEKMKLMEFLKREIITL